ncbi:MAG: SGNH/GDSL hydrolase family protein [Thermoguttaceae bacterium]
MNPLRFVSASVVAVFLALLPVRGYPDTPPAASPAASPQRSAETGPELLANRRVMVLGDSITQGGGYVTFIEYLLQKYHPALDFDIVSVGLSSETTSGLSEEGHAGGKFPRPCLHERLGRALEAVKPALVVACYGMNDGIYLPYSEDRMRAFRDGITRMVERCNAAGAQVVLVTPPAYDNWGSESQYDTVLARFAAWQMSTPPQGVAAVADLHTLMADALAQRQKKDPEFHFAKDGIHPNELGHLVMALSILNELNVETPSGTPEELLPVITADPLFALVRKHREVRSAGWLQHIGYTRERVVQPGSGDIVQVEAEAAELQRQVDALRRK